MAVKNIFRINADTLLLGGTQEWLRCTCKQTKFTLNKKAN